MAQLKPLESYQLATPGERPHFHFAASSGGHLYAMQADQWPGEKSLKTWTLSDDLVPTLAHELALPTHFYDPGYQFITDRDLWLWRGVSGGPAAIVRVDLSKPAAPSVVALVEPGDLHAAIAVGEVLYTLDAHGFSRSPLPTIEAPKPTPELVIPTATPVRAEQAAAIGGSILWSTQDGVQVQSADKLGHRLKLNHVSTFPLPVSATRVAILETGDGDLRSIELVDFDGKKASKAGDFHPKHCVLAWALAGSTLYVALEATKLSKGKKVYALKLAAIETAKAEALWDLVLPFDAAQYKRETMRVRWIGVAGSTIAIMLGNGTYQRFTLA